MSKTLTQLMSDPQWSRQATDTVGKTPVNDPIVRIYNSYWGLATGSRMFMIGDIYGIQGSWLRDPMKVKTLLYSPVVAGVDVRPSGFFCLRDLLNQQGVDLQWTVVNGEKCLVTNPIEQQFGRYGELTHVPTNALPDTSFIDAGDEPEKFLQSQYGGQWSVGAEIVGVVKEDIYIYRPAKKIDVEIPGLPDVSIYEVGDRIYATSSNIYINEKLRSLSWASDADVIASIHHTLSGRQ